jgi:hypothetical protein
MQPQIVGGYGVEGGEGGEGGGEGGEGGDGGLGGGETEGVGAGGGEGGEGGRGGGEDRVPMNSCTATKLPSREGRAGIEMEMLIEASAGRQTSTLDVQGPYPSTGPQAPTEAGSEDGVTETEVLTWFGLRSSICTKLELAMLHIFKSAEESQ